MGKAQGKAFNDPLKTLHVYCKIDRLIRGSVSQQKWGWGVLLFSLTKMACMLAHITCWLTLCAGNSELNGSFRFYACSV